MGRNIHGVEFEDERWFVWNHLTGVEWCLMRGSAQRKTFEICGMDKNPGRNGRSPSVPGSVEEFRPAGSVGCQGPGRRECRKGKRTVAGWSISLCWVRFDESALGPMGSWPFLAHWDPWGTGLIDVQPNSSWSFILKYL